MQTPERIGRFADVLALRRRLLRLAPLRRMRERAALARRAAYRPSDDRVFCPPGLIDLLEEQGVCVLPHLADLMDQPAQAVRDTLAEALAIWTEPHPADVLESDELFARAPSCYLLGLDPMLLDLAESYLREPCFYLGAALKRERVDDPSEGPRQWHRDIEDDHLLRLIIYLHAVDERTGPFHYLDRARSDDAALRLHYRSGYLPDAVFHSAIAAADCRTMCGPEGTVAIFDGARIFHRAGRPTMRDRFSLTLTYSSRFPRQILHRSRLLTPSRAVAAQSLSARQHACLPAGRSR